MERLLNISKTVFDQFATRSRLLDRQQKISISAAVALVTALYAAYKIVTPPARLRHIPRLGFFAYVNGFLRMITMDEMSRTITLPVALKTTNGVYLRFDYQGWSVHIARPEAAKKFLLKSDIFTKGDLVSERGESLFGRLVFRKNILMLNGPEWKAHRKIANPAFHRSMPVELFGKLTQKTLHMMDAMDSDTFDVPDVTGRFALDVIGLAGFDFDFHAIEDPQSEWVLRYRRIFEATFDPWFLLFPSLDQQLRFLFPGRQRMHRELDIMLDMIYEVITHKRQILKDQKSKVSEPERDLLTLMIEAENSNEGTMSNEELRNNIVLFFLAGHDTTANSLAYAAYHLAANPDVQRKARDEAIRVLGDGPQDILPTFEQTRELSYINMVIKETLRFSPPVGTTLMRESTEDTDLAGTFIPKGTTTMVDIYELQHNPTVWSDPEIFRPERFEHEGEADKLARLGMSWLPFSNGARQCIGMNFSLVEQRVFLPMLLRKYEIQIPADSIHKEKLVTNGLGVVKPKDLKLTFKKRY